MSFYRFRRVLPTASALAILAVLVGCETVPGRAPDPAVVEEAPVAPPPPYVVRFGDTLSTIALALGLDYRALAQANDLEYPYTIYAGQVLSLAVGELTRQEVDRIEAARRDLIAKKRNVVPPTPTRPQDNSGAEDEDAAAPRESVAGETPHLPADAAGEAPGTAMPAQPTVFVSSDIGNGRWQWPASGPVVAEFSATDHKGIDIGGEARAPVYAAADGVVQQVYDNVPNYGRLLVIQHGAQYLGFYGHNARVLVDVGDSVRRGQQVAEMGDSGTDSVKLHFELRRNARPIDPRDVMR